MSLWSVDDKYTEELMRSFYGYLKQGTPRALALTMAKRDFVKRNTTAGPFFWSGFILYGDNQALQLTQHHVLGFYLVMGFLLLGGGLTWFVVKSRVLIR